MLHNHSLKFSFNEETKEQLKAIEKAKAIFTEDIQFLMFVIKFLVDKLNDAGGSAPAAAANPNPENFRISQYTFADREVDGFDMRVELSDIRKNLWSVRSGSYRLSNKLQWSSEPLPGNRNQFFIETHSFPLPEALRVAEEKAKVNREKKSRT